MAYGSISRGLRKHIKYADWLGHIDKDGSQDATFMSYMVYNITDLDKIAGWRKLTHSPYGKPPMLGGERGFGFEVICRLSLSTVGDENRPSWSSQDSHSDRNSVAFQSGVAK